MLGHRAPGALDDLSRRLEGGTLLASSRDTEHDDSVARRDPFSARPAEAAPR